MGLADAEVEHLRALAGLRLRVVHEEDVLRFQIAMDDVLGVGRGQGCCALPRDPQRLDHRKLAHAIHALGERLAFEQLHHDVRGRVVVVAEVEDLHDAAIGDGRGRARLVEEALDDLGLLRELWVQRLHRRLAPEQHVLCEEHVAHAALTDGTDDPVLANVSPCLHDPATVRATGRFVNRII